LIAKKLLGPSSRLSSSNAVSALKSVVSAARGTFSPGGMARPRIALCKSVNKDEKATQAHLKMA
jgi:hypothetical protein